MKRYTVVLPVTGTFTVQVTAESKEEAIYRALNGDEWPENPELDGWEVHREITRGNVFSGMQNDAEIIDEEDIDEAD